MELCRATLSCAHTAVAPFLPAPPPSSPVRDFRKRRGVCLNSSNSESTESPKDTQMVVSITGATGFIGRRLVQKLLADKHKVRVLTRSRTKARFVFPVENFPEIIIAEEEEWKKCIEGSNAVVNLAGMPISTRWSPEIKKEIKQSRVNVTSKVVYLINHTSAEVRPSVLVSATAIGYYGTSENQVFDETSPSGNDYLSETKPFREGTDSFGVSTAVVSKKQMNPAYYLNPRFQYTVPGIDMDDELLAALRNVIYKIVPDPEIASLCIQEVCREWETKAHDVDNGVRLVLIRIGIVLGKDGGALAKMIPLFMMFAGGPLGTGNQWFSWIHLDDLVNLICESLTNPSYKGVINGTGPNPVRLSEMCDQLGQVIGRPSWLPVPDFAIKAVLGEGASIVLEGQRVLPAKAKQLGFSYKYPYVKDALKAIVREL